MRSREPSTNESAKRLMDRVGLVSTTVLPAPASAQVAAPGDCVTSIISPAAPPTVTATGAVATRSGSDSTAWASAAASTEADPPSQPSGTGNGSATSWTSSSPVLLPRLRPDTVQMFPCHGGLADAVTSPSRKVYGAANG